MGFWTSAFPRSERSEASCRNDDSRRGFLGGDKVVTTRSPPGQGAPLGDDFRNAVHELIAPDIFPVEVAHALTRAERQGRIALAQSTVLWANVMTTVPQLHPTSALLPRAIEISSQMRIGVYDCLYVTLAERERCELITADDKLVKNLQPHF